MYPLLGYPKVGYRMHYQGADVSSLKDYRSPHSLYLELVSPPGGLTLHQTCCAVPGYRFLMTCRQD